MVGVPTRVAFNKKRRYYFKPLVPRQGWCVKSDEIRGGLADKHEDCSKVNRSQ